MNTIGERINILRKSQNLTLEKFGEKLGVTKTAISRLEKNERNVTDQMIKSICREFHVDYIWLTTGAGEMFQDSDEVFLEQEVPCERHDERHAQSGGGEDAVGLESDALQPCDALQQVVE